MQDIVFGILAILVGVFFCFSGRYVLRIAILVWGAFAGFAFGAGLMAALSDERFLGTVLGWVLGFVFALIFAVFAYLYYAVGVVLAMASIGFALGAALITALGINWNWLIILIGVLAGAALALLAILTDLPMVLLIVLSALGGASVAVTGVMLLFGVISVADFTQEGFTSRIDDDWWWYLAFLVLAFAGALTQSRDAQALRREIRASW